MRCPKCKHTQNSTMECEACGLIFARYRAVQERKKKAAEEKIAAKSSGGSGLTLSTVVVLILVAVSATYYFTTRSPKKAEQNATPSAEQLAITTPASGEKKTPVRTKPVTHVAASPKKHEHSLSAAGRATVSIETPFGSGSGFFIRDEWIVTNRHVIEMNAKKVEEARVQYEKAKRFTDLEEEKLEGYRERLRSVPDGPAKSQLEMIIEHKEGELAKAQQKLTKIEEQLARLEEPIDASDIKIILANGDEHYANYLMVSDNYDLALLSLYADSHAILDKSNRPLAQGDKVYTIGSPVGLRQTVTSGIFSAYRSRDGDTFLQTDAAINPGNSGGPLIDEQGYVHGINTFILSNTEGIGFAIPIETVFQEFSSTLL